MMNDFAQIRFHATSESTCESVAFRTAFSLVLCIALACSRNSFVAGAEKQAGSGGSSAGDVSRSRELDQKIKELAQLSDQELAAGRFDQVTHLTTEFISLQSMRYGADSWRVRHSEVLRDSYSRIALLRPDDQDRVRRAISMTHIGSRLADESKFAQASTILEKAVGMLNELVGASDIHTTDAELRYAAALADRGKADEAKELIIRVVKVRKALAGIDSLYYADAVKCLGEIYLKAGMLEDAEANLRVADGTYLKLFEGGSVFKRIVAIAQLVAVLVKAKKYSDAEPIARESVRLAAQKMKEHPKLYIQTRIYLSLSLNGQGKMDAAATEFAEIMRIVDGWHASPEYLIDVIGRYVIILDAAGRVQEAAAYRKRLDELKDEMAAEQRAAEETLAPPPE